MMASESITADMVREAGIAASMAANPDTIPAQSIYAQDFSFGGTMFDAAFGNAEALGGVGSAVADVAVEERMKLEEKERRENDPAKDAGMITELAERQREEAARVANGQIVINGIAYSREQIDQALDVTEERINARADREGWSDERRADAMESIQRVRDAETLEEVAAATNDMERDNPVVFDEFEQGLEDLDPSNLRAEETNDREVATIDDAQTWEAGAADIVEVTDTLDVAEASRDSTSIGENPFADTRASAASFNPAARGETAQTELAENTTPTPASEQRFEI